MGTVKREYKISIDPQNIFKAMWDAVVSLFIIIYCFIIPYRFNPTLRAILILKNDRWCMRIDNKTWLKSDILFDCFTLLDIILTFFTGVMRGNVVIKRL